MPLLGSQKSNVPSVTTQVLTCCRACWDSSCMWRSSRGRSQVCRAAITGCSQSMAGWEAPCRALTCTHPKEAWLRPVVKPKL